MCIRDSSFRDWKLSSWTKIMQSLADAWPFSGGNKKRWKRTATDAKRKVWEKELIKSKIKTCDHLRSRRNGTGRTNPAKSGSAKFRRSRSWQWLLRPVWQDAMNYHIVLLLLKNAWDLVQVYRVLMNKFYSFREHSPTFLAPSRRSTIFYKLRTQGRGV